MTTGLIVRLALFLLLGISTAQAQWTGISADIGEIRSDMQFETGLRNMRVSSLAVHIEEKTAKSLRVGFGIGQTSIRTANPSPPSNAQKFEGNFLEIYLRQPLQIGEQLSLEGLFTHRYYAANDSNVGMRSEIEWRDTRLQINLGVKLESFRITSFVVYRNLSGDISDDTGTELFDSVDRSSHGINFDYFVEPTAYIRLQFSRGDEQGGYLTFARVY